MGLRALLNDLIKWVYEQGLTRAFYLGFHVLALVVSALFNVWYCKKYGIGRAKGFFMTVAQNAIDYVWMTVYCWILSGFTHFGGGNAVKIIVFAPLFLVGVAKLFKVDWKTSWDFMAPDIVIYFGICKIGCVFSGCCEGYPSSWGLYNIKYGTTLFPVQIFETVVSLAIAVVLIIRSRDRGYRVDGLSFPLLLIFFGFTRFLLEFARNNEKIWLGCSEFSFHALFMVLVGVIMYVLIKRHNSAKPEKADDALLITEKI